MNKIVLDKEENKLKNVQGIIEIKNKQKIILEGNNKIILKGNNIEITLLDNASLDLKIFKRNLKENSNIIINQYNNTNIILRYSLTSHKNININIIDKIIGNNNKSNLNLRCISYLNKIKVNIIESNQKNTYNNEIIENIKGITKKGKIEVLPNMEINTNEVIANHYVTISSISKDDLFYLMSKGLSKSLSEKIILKGFLKGIMEVMTNE